MNSRIARHLVGLIAVVSAFVLFSPVAANAAGCSQADSQAASQKYLDALVDRNAAWSIPLDPFVIRYENGLPTSVSAADLKLQLFLHIQYSVYTSIENLVWTWQPGGRADVINATYHLPVEVAGVPLAGSTVVEDFTLTADCKIKRIDATFTIEPPA
jgi:hypothetical protein